jgi:succinyldiaminopimelate transaminase
MGPGPAPVSHRLPVFPWDSLGAHAEVARRHPGGVVDLSIGTPVDPTPDSVQAALRLAADAPGYPLTYGTPALRAAVAAWFARRLDVPGLDPDGVLPTVGSKELVAWLPTLLGLGAGDVVAVPSLAYPTYDVGARLAGAEPVATDDPTTLDANRLRLIWLNSPSNPTGAVLPAAAMRRVVDWARRRRIVVASDECYIELPWEARATTVLHPSVSGASHRGVLAVHSLSKRSNLAGYRAAFVAGDVALVEELLAVRKHAGMIVPAPVQAALTAALGDDAHVDAQRAVYAARRARLRPALHGAGWSVTQSEAGLYLWASHPAYDAWGSVTRLAGLGILVAPGTFYGPDGRNHVRLALTATDERIEAAVQRLALA